jgi:PAS domain S-box-containing protein
LKVTFVFIGYVVAVFLLLGSIIWKIFPECFNEVIGLTPFKKISEYIIALTLFTSVVLLIRMRSSFGTDVLKFLVASIMLTIASEISFTLYTQAYGPFNLIGHYFKIISFYLIYKAFIQTGLVKPYNLLFRNLKQSQEVLRKSEARYRGIVEDQTEVICRFTPDGTHTFVNVAYCRYFGKKGDELVGHKFMSFIPEDDHKAVEEHFASFSPENPVATHEHRAIAPSGEIRWQQWTNRAIYDKQGHLIEFQSVGRDITKRKLAEEALRESEEKYRSMMEAMNDPVYICSQDFRVTYMNPVMIQRTGRDATGEPCYKVIHELDEKCPWCVHERIQQGEC